MALSPLIKPDDRIQVVPKKVNPSRTYEFDFDRGEFTGGMIDDDDALHQFIRKALVTARYRYLIYDRSFGSELETLVAQDLTKELVGMEIPRMVKDAIVYDERISDVNNFKIEKVEGDDKVFISFFVVLNSGRIISERVKV